MSSSSDLSREESDETLCHTCDRSAAAAVDVNELELTCAKLLTHQCQLLSGAQRRISGGKDECRVPDSSAKASRP